MRTLVVAYEYPRIATVARATSAVGARATT